MSEENDKVPDSEQTCRNLAEELLREMPDMKDEIEQELRNALSKSSDCEANETQSTDSNKTTEKENDSEKIVKEDEVLEVPEDEELATPVDVHVAIENLNTAESETIEIEEEAEVNKDHSHSTENMNEDIIEEADIQNINEGTVKNSENTDLKIESLFRKRENENGSDSGSSRPQESTNAKKPKLDISTERKSIIEIHIANKVIDVEESLTELERVRKIKEQSIIELHRLKCQEDKLLRIENINKQLQKNIEQSRVNFRANGIEEGAEKNKLIVTESTIDNNISTVAISKVNDKSNQESTCVEAKLSTPACAEPSFSSAHADSSEFSHALCDSNVQQDSEVPDLTASNNITLQETLNANSDVMQTEDSTAGVPPATDSAMCEELSDTHVDVEMKEANAVNTGTPTASTHPDEGSNHQILGEPEIHSPPEELTAEEEERDRELRASRATFLQHLPCFKLQRSGACANKSDTNSNDSTSSRHTVPRCRECRRRNLQGGSDVYCRFYEFRRLQYNEAGELLVAGFPNPYTDPTPDDLRIWQPDEYSVPTAGWMDIQVARYILLHAGDQFCYLWQQEAEALRLHENPNTVIAWKKVVQGLREICDVCDTTLFNFHWTCEKCGFGVCLDCFKDRKEQRSCHKKRAADKLQRGHDEYHWMLCSATTPTHQKHELRDLMLTQIIASDALNVLGRLLHDVRAMWQVPQMCGCLLSKQDLPPDTELGTLIQDMIKESQLKQQTSASSLATEETLRKQARMEELHAKKLEFARARGIDYVPGRVWTKQTLGKDPITTAYDNFKHINFLRKGLAGLRRFLPPRAMTLTYSTMLAPGVPHEWLCDGKLLRLTNAMHPDNRILYQEVWKCGQPVMISEVARSLNLDLWRPEAFCNDFGDIPNDLINCLNGNLVPNQPMRNFWEGFQCIKKRLLDANGKPMLLKLKDWPPGDDFAEILPTRFADLMAGLPMPEYTLRTGNLNIASCLPKMFVPPDLGPKMYNAYGSALHPDKGTTNLHLDISDAVNIMVYVGVPQDADSKPQLVATQKAIALGGCDYLTRARCQSPDVLPGALWHIFPARDADKIRDLLNRVTIEKGFRLEPDHDPIHDQNWYLDDKLRARLFKEYGVEGYPIVQCLGDAVFIPAGAPHQVQNLHNCIKVAEDFVSPENITHCYHLTHEFRHLSHSHTNHEDKLQIKNIIYHAIKDCCHILVRALHQRLDEELAKVEEQNEKLEASLKETTELAAKLNGDDAMNGN
ncbi:unnamed protein product [Ceratitis capitata]|uniref:[histone H3]-dimethyl-L-lysine(9) demethylase n=1 Tax=Ceratitis capitata TaxID=7213 RepID=A0A811TYC3_CERCA|nr:unnamed protein product [Ceratitis capitata]